jgi:hypothetical protein
LHVLFSSKHDAAQDTWERAIWHTHCTMKHNGCFLSGIL